MKVIHNDKIKEIPTMPNKNGVDVILHEIEAEGHRVETITNGPQGKKEWAFVLDDEAFAKWTAKAKAEIDKIAASSSPKETPSPYTMKQALKLTGQTNIDNVVEALKKQKEEKKGKKKKEENKDKNSFGGEKPFDPSTQSPLLDPIAPEPTKLSYLTAEDYERLQRQQELPPLDMNMEDIGISTIEELAGEYGYNMDVGISVFAVPVTLPITMTEKLRAKANLMAEAEKIKISDYFIRLMLKDIMEKEGRKK